MVCVSGILTTTSLSSLEKGAIRHSRQMPQIATENAETIRLNLVSLSLASELQQQRTK